MNEMEDALVEGFDGVLCLDHARLPQDLSRATVLLVRVHGFSTEELILCRRLRERGARVVLYVFDAWDFPNKVRRRQQWIRRVFGAGARLTDCADALCVPFRRALEALDDRTRAIALHIPLGVDAYRIDPGVRRRLPLVVGYGRQPPAVTASLSDHFNRPGSSVLFQHTDHIAISAVTDPLRHRRQFWQTLGVSQIALAYNHAATDGAGARYDVVGQRWFECWAAGSVIVGRRPETAEFDEIADWPDAAIEAPEDPATVPAFILDLMLDQNRVTAASAASMDNARRRFDWRVRMAPVLSA